MDGYRIPNVLMVGAGEYNVGLVYTGHGAAPDKKAGVTGIVLFDLRRRGRVGRILLADIDGRRISAARAVMQEKIGDAYKDMDITVEAWPKDESLICDEKAPLDAMDSLLPGDAVVIFTPDLTHFSLAMAAINRRLHVLIAKPVTKSLSEHSELVRAADQAGVLCVVEYHKRFDPIYGDARERARGLGGFSFYSSFMSQRKVQLDTFRGWAGLSSDISFYLNSHHIDWLAWTLQGRAVPVQVTAAASLGVANTRLDREGVEDTITLLVKWRSLTSQSESKSMLECGHSVFTSSWIAPQADCHTQQYMHFVGHNGEIRADQAHRGYNLSAEGEGLAALNPLYMRYVPDSSGRFAGQQGYGYRSIEAFTEEVLAIGRGLGKGQTLGSEILAHAADTLVVTAILEAGRRSLDRGGKPVGIGYKDDKPLELLEM